MEKINYEKLLKEAVGVINSKKGANIVAYNVKGLTSFTNYIIIVSLNSEVQMNAVLKGLREKIKMSCHIEGKAASGWVLVDYDGVIINLFLPHERDFYGLERLWGDAERMKV